MARGREIILITVGGVLLLLSHAVVWRIGSGPAPKAKPSFKRDQAHSQNQPHSAGSREEEEGAGD